MIFFLERIFYYNIINHQFFSTFEKNKHFYETYFENSYKRGFFSIHNSREGFFDDEAS